MADNYNIHLSTSNAMTTQKVIDFYKTNTNYNVNKVNELFVDSFCL